jgi:hypothetical protein
MGQIIFNSTAALFRFSREHSKGTEMEKKTIIQDDKHPNTKDFYLLGNGT